MKCQNCGAEIGNSKTCEYCGSKITVEMQKEQEQLNKVGCPKCGSTNIKFAREKQGEATGKKGTQIMRVTTGMCNDCGYTWQTQNTPKKRKTWLWVLGWIFIFPLPLTLILLKKKDMKPPIKYAIIAIAWIIYLIIAFGGKTTDSPTPTNTKEPITQQVEVTTDKPETTSANEENEKESSEEKTEEETSEELTGVRDEVKKALEEYEAFFDEYIEFMEKYSKSDNSSEMLIEYTEYMTKYTEAMEALDKMEDMEMSPEENALYVETMARINEKLTKYAYTN